MFNPGAKEALFMNIEKYGINPFEAIGIFSAGATLGAVAVRGYMRSLLHDEGHRVYIAPDFNALKAIVEVCDINGLEPSREITDEKVSQALMSDNKTVFLVAKDEVLDELGGPTAAPMLRVKDPEEAANTAQLTLMSKGFEAKILNPLEGQSEGEIRFIKTNALSCGLIGFREHVVKMGSKPPKWNPARSMDFTSPNN
jgi:hypothetical protein